MSDLVCLFKKSTSVMETTNETHSNCNKNGKLNKNLANSHYTLIQNLQVSVKSIVKIASINIESLILENENSQSENNITDCPFYTSIKPQASIYEFIIAIASFTKMQVSSIILAIKYIDRYCDINDYKLSYLNIYKLILTSIIVSLKYNEDQIIKFDYFSKFSILTIKELVLMENHFLEGLNFKLYVCSKSYDLIELYLIEKLKANRKNEFKLS